MINMKINPKKRFINWQYVGSVLLVLMVGLATFRILDSQSHVNRNVEPVKETKKAQVAEPTLPKISFAAMGDMLAHDSVVNQAKTNEGYDFKPYFTNIRPLYESSDVVFCNPETPSAGPSFGISGYPTFNAPVEFSRDLVASGCNLINLASNHMADKGQSALNETIDQYDALGVLARHGANRSLEEQGKVSYFTKNDIKVAFVAFADFSNGRLPSSYSVNLYHDNALVQRLLEEARSNADLVIVSAHWGTEDSHEVSVSQRNVAQDMANLGVDVIIGTGPHVIQPVEWIDRPDGQKTLVWYSIGNSLSSQLGVDQLTGGVAKFTVTKDENKLEISDVAFEGTLMSYEWSEADRQASRLETRQNLRLDPLSQADEGAARLGVTTEERRRKLSQWLGGSVDLLD